MILLPLISLHSNLVLFKSKSKDGYFRAKVLYIPIWFYSNVYRFIHIGISNALYIPIWFYSNNLKNTDFSCANALYIPIWFYSNPKPRCKFRILIFLYIPIWFYSNMTRSFFDMEKEGFTFQSGSIQILLVSILSMTLPSFTFQSGSIQILNTIFDWSRFVPLHSNLVLFKLRTSNLIHLQQSLHSTLVLFKLCFRTTQN